MQTFHVTPARNIDAILASGLIPAIGERSTELGEAAPAIYLFPTIEDAEDAVGNWLGESFDEDEELALFAVDITDIPYVQEVEWEIIVSEAVSADRMEVLYSNY